MAAENREKVAQQMEEFAKNIDSTKKPWSF